jgi:pilus assembly protein Flp/PilA
MTTSILSLVKRFAREERGASFVEYAILTGLVAAVVIVSIGTMSGGLTTLFGKLNTTLGGVTTGTPPGGG